MHVARALRVWRKVLRPVTPKTPALSLACLRRRPLSQVRRGARGGSAGRGRGLRDLGAAARRRRRRGATVARLFVSKRESLSAGAVGRVSLSLGTEPVGEECVFRTGEGQPQRSACVFSQRAETTRDGRFEPQGRNLFFEPDSRAILWLSPQQESLDENRLILTLSASNDDVRRGRVEYDFDTAASQRPADISQLDESEVRFRRDSRGAERILDRRWLTRWSACPVAISDHHRSSK